jgi:hypothetical protein
MMQWRLFFVPFRPVSDAGAGIGARERFSLSCCQLKCAIGCYQKAMNVQRITGGSILLENFITRGEMRGARKTPPSSLRAPIHPPHSSPLLRAPHLYHHGFLSFFGQLPCIPMPDVDVALLDTHGFFLCDSLQMRSACLLYTHCRLLLVFKKKNTHAYSTPVAFKEPTGSRTRERAGTVRVRVRQKNPR